MQGDKTVAFCNRNCNIISPFVRAPANRNETIMLKPGLEQLALSAKAAGFRLKGSVISLDGVYNSRRNRKAIFNLGMTPNIPEKRVIVRKLKEAESRFTTQKFLRKDLTRSNVTFHGKTSLSVCC